MFSWPAQCGLTAFSSSDIYCSASFPARAESSLWLRSLLLHLHLAPSRFYPSISNPLRGGQKKLRIISTPNGLSNKFADLWFAGRGSAGVPPVAEGVSPEAAPLSPPRGEGQGGY